MIELSIIFIKLTIKFVYEYIIIKRNKLYRSRQNKVLFKRLEDNNYKVLYEFCSLERKSTKLYDTLSLERNCQ